MLPVSYTPPMIALGIFEHWDTFKNIQDSGEFVVAYPSPDLIEKIEISAERFPREISEFDKAKLTPVSSKIIQPFKVKECQVNLECQLEWLKPAGDHHVVVGRIVAADIWETLYDNSLARAMIEPVYDTGCEEARYAQKGSLIK